jgi:hypothetical protein
MSFSTNNNSKQSENGKKKMGISQVNFYKKTNDLNYFPDLVYHQKPNTFNKNDNWLLYSYPQQNNLNILVNNNMDFQYIYDFEYKRPEEKLKKGQNQLIFEKLQQKYISQLKEKNPNMIRTKTGFYKKNSKNKNVFKVRQRSAIENQNDAVKDMLNPKNPLDKNNKDKKIINTNNQKISIDAGKNDNINTKEKMFNKTFNNGFNIKKRIKN